MIGLCQNKNITEEFIETHLELSWNIYVCALTRFNENISIEFIRKYPEWDWYIDNTYPAIKNKKILIWKFYLQISI